MAAFGIHIGTTNSCLSVYKDGNTEVVANAAGDRTTPTLVAFSTHDKVVGLPAKQGLIRNAKNTVCRAKRLLGRQFADPEVQKEINNSQCSIIEKDGKPVYQVQYLESQKLFSPEQCISFLFETLKDLAKNHSDGNVFDAVISVPCEFAESQLNVVKSAAARGGFNVLRFIYEPTATLLAYDVGLKHHHEHVYCMVVRLGGSSCTVTCYSVIGGMYKILSNIHSDEVGGDLFTQLIALHFSKDFLRQYKEDPQSNQRSWSKLMSASETCKHTLTNLPNAHCSVDSLHDGIDFSSNIASKLQACRNGIASIIFVFYFRARVDLLNQSLLTQLQNLLDEALTASSLSKDQIQKVVLSGGGSKMPCVSKKVQDYLSNAEVHFTLPADEVIAIGCAKQAGIILSNSCNNDVSATASIPCIQKPISAIVENCEPEVIFAANLPIPTRIKKTFSSSQSVFKMVVTQGDDHSELLAKVILKDISEESVINAQFNLNSDGSLHINCMDEISKSTSELSVPVSSTCSARSC
ncbi:hypothetical protein EB796_002484 [Bugula neritina]|uniref:Heat shock 70 kDa protein 14 n=1 Tax=Bugula neritina TaxID=10212 RepID=A0A7J7KM26_BUGNE|nr:hypothetical protein EB796_002484 [Bugula neritina]